MGANNCFYSVSLCTYRTRSNYLDSLISPTQNSNYLFRSITTGHDNECHFNYSDTVFHVVLAHTVYCTATGSSYARSSRSSASANFGTPSRINLAFSTSSISPVSLAMHGTSTPPWISGDHRRLPVISHLMMPP